MRFFVGIDGGQSSTTVLIGDETGQVIGSAKGGPCNHVSSTEAGARFKSVIGTCVSRACVSAGLDPEAVHFVSACCGMSGGPEDKVTLLRQALSADNLSVMTDGEIALFGAMSGGPGIIVIAGTGSIAFGRNDEGTVKRVGGWGYLFGDEGSAFDIVRQAVRASLRLEEGWGSATELQSALLAETHTSGMNQLLHLFYTADWPRSRVASLARLVDSVAVNGDITAREILEQASQSLASMAVCIRAQLFHGSDRVRVAPSGGVFQSEVVRTRFQTIVELQEGCSWGQPDLAPVAGALLSAYRAAGRTVTLRDVPVLK